MADSNVAQQVLDAQNLEEAIRLRVAGAHWREISNACGYASPAAALKAVGDAMAAATQRADETADMMRNTAQMRYEKLLSDALSMVDHEEHPVYDKEGVEVGVEDDRAVRLRAVDEARRLITDIAKLQQLDKIKDEPDTGDQGGIRIIGVAVEDIV